MDVWQWHNSGAVRPGPAEPNRVVNLSQLNAFHSFAVGSSGNRICRNRSRCYVWGRR